MRTSLFILNYFVGLLLAAASAHLFKEGSVIFGAILVNLSLNCLIMATHYQKEQDKNNS